MGMQWARILTQAHTVMFSIHRLHPSPQTQKILIFDAKTTIFPLHWSALETVPSYSYCTMIHIEITGKRPLDFCHIYYTTDLV